MSLELACWLTFFYFVFPDMIITDFAYAKVFERTDNEQTTLASTIRVLPTLDAAVSVGVELQRKEVL